MKKMISKFADSLLSREELKRVKGGYGGSCHAQTSVQGQTFQGTMAEVQNFAANSGLHWCCDSCGSASWM
ncbi:hypothetical protein SAMN06298216_0081 [Spirosomataceae bacterium TFI 002]|nr:hypothetical protein SAMN06298216_0081 [Spirosomataceae bacterium TFI 002]